ncbi:MAG: hypothetical protein KDE27_12485 [Planctomycetes bacterium]|nr:hypothetical protein [Planctomycetota bacterium]
MADNFTIRIRARWWFHPVMAWFWLRFRLLPASDASRERAVAMMKRAYFVRIGRGPWTALFPRRRDE